MSGRGAIARGGSVRGERARRLLALVLALCVSPGAVTAQGDDALEPVIHRGGQARFVGEEANKWRLELVLTERRERGILPPAPDDTVVRAELARMRLEARAGLLVTDMARTTDASAEQVTALKGVLTRATLREHLGGKASESEFAHDWVDDAWSRVIDSDAWRLCQESTLTDIQRDALVVAEDVRAQRFLEARIRVAVVSLASELRLRRPQLEQLEPLVADWVRERVPKRADLLAGDVVAELLAVSTIREELSLVQLSRLKRMRSAKRAIILEDGAPGDDLGLGRGRYPEDDYALEICALALYHGWSWEELEDLRGVGGMLARRVRRAKPRAWRSGARNLTLGTIEFEDEPLWQAVLERERGARGVAEPAPPPACTDVQAMYVDARVEFLVALFDDRILLSESQREVLLERLEDPAAYEYRRSRSGQVALDRQPNWGLLRLDAFTGSKPRRTLAKALAGALDPDQLIELGL